MRLLLGVLVLLGVIYANNAAVSFSLSATNPGKVFTRNLQSLVFVTFVRNIFLQLCLYQITLGNAMTRN